MNPFKTIYHVEKNGKVFTLHWKNRYDPTMVGGGQVAASAAGIGMLSNADIFPTEEKEQDRFDTTKEQLGSIGEEDFIGDLLTGLFTGIGGSVIGTGELLASFLTGGGQRRADPNSSFDKTTELQARQKELTSLGTTEIFDNLMPFSILRESGLSHAKIGSLTKDFYGG